MKKRQDIELLRVISAFGIVWFHSGEIGNDLAYSGLVVFVVLSLYLAAQSSTTKGIADRAKRLLAPWLVWFVIYGLINLARHKPFILADDGIVSGILAGTSIHLWFLPFIFFVLLAFDYLCTRISSRPLGFASGVLAVIALSAAPEWRPWSTQLGAPYAQFAHAMSGAFIGIFLAKYYYLPIQIRTGLLAAILTLAAYLTYLPMPGVGLPYLLGVGICATVLLVNLNFSVKYSFGWLSESTLGIYLVHPIFFLLLYKTKLVSGLAIPVVAFFASAIAVTLIKRIAPDASKYAV